MKTNSTPKFKSEWFYDGWKQYGNQDKYVQKDWNETLLMEVNRASARLNQSALKGPATLIYIHPTTFEIFKSFKKQSDKYEIKVGEYWSMRQLLVCSDKYSEYAQIDIRNYTYENIIREQERNYKPLINPETGEIDFKFNQLEINQDFFID